MMMERGLTYDFLAGIPYHGYREIPLFPLGRWLFGIAVILSLSGVWLGSRRKIAAFEMVRFGSRKRWWDFRFWTLFLVVAAGCFCYEFCICGLDFLMGIQKSDSMEELLIRLLWQVHIMTLVSVFCVLDITAIWKTAPAVIFMTEVSTFAAGIFCRKVSKFMFGSWGMYMQSNVIDVTDGFSQAAVLIIECMIIVAAWGIGAKMSGGQGRKAGTIWNISWN